MILPITDDSLLDDDSVTEELNKLTLGPLEKKVQQIIQRMENDKMLLQKELRDMRCQIFDISRQISKLCLFFHGAAVDQLLNKKEKNIFMPMIRLLERYYKIYIPDWEIGNVHPVSKFKNGEKIWSVIVKWNSRHDLSCYWYVS